MSATSSEKPLEARLAEVLAIHFDPDAGTPYWLERLKKYDFDPREEIRSITDLPKMGLMEPADLRSRSWEHFVPRCTRLHREKAILAQTGGTLGRPAWTAYDEREFEEAFVEPFAAAAEHVGFPKGGTWLYVGPSGPHIIGRAADAIARRSGAAAPFTVDFDSRWANKLPPGSFAAERYLNHIVEQALDVIARQDISVLFTTPSLLAYLADKMTAAQRERIEGVHYGGAALNPHELRAFQCERFEGAVHLSGYGNTLFGCCLELTAGAGRTPEYFPYGGRLLLGVMAERDDGCGVPSYDAVGAHGRVVFSRLDRTMLLINVVERDEGRLVEPPNRAPPGFTNPGVASPQPRRGAARLPGAVIY